MNENKMNSLNERELENVAGAVADPVGAPIRNAKGDEVGRYNTIKDKTILYDPCPRCKKPMHRGTFNWLYCDPCNYKDVSGPSSVWHGTAEELAAASL